MKKDEHSIDFGLSIRVKFLGGGNSSLKARQGGKAKPPTIPLPGDDYDLSAAVNARSSSPFPFESLL